MNVETILGIAIVTGLLCLVTALIAFIVFVKYRLKGSTSELFKCDKQGISMRYRLICPNCNDQKAPLIVFLHGSGAMGEDNYKQMLELSQVTSNMKEKCYVLAPKFIKGMQNIDLDDLVYGSNIGKVLAEMVDEIVNKHNIDTQKIYVIGLSLGTYYALDLVQFTDVFAGCILLMSGNYYLKDMIPAENHDLHDESVLENFAIDKLIQMPLWLTHSLDDKTNPYRGSEILLEKITQAGGQEVVMTTYEKGGHGVSKRFLKEQLWEEWLLKQEKKQGNLS